MRPLRRTHSDTHSFPTNGNWAFHPSLIPVPGPLILTKVACGHNQAGRFVLQVVLATELWISAERS
jgi:hypothetical protein